jgi:gas vesicle protein GvpL/GvpF
VGYHPDTAFGAAPARRRSVGAMGRTLDSQKGLRAEGRGPRPPTGTYVFCVIAAKVRPSAKVRPRGPAGLGAVRLLDVERGLFLAVADAPLNRYNEDAINRGLADLDWVSRAAVAHEAIVESFIDQTAVLPMKLFTIFASDARALEHVRASRTKIAAMVKRVANHQEWGVRVVLDRTRAERVRGSKPSSPRLRPDPSGPATGLAYLSAKKAQRDAAAELADRARETVAALYDRLDARSRLAVRRAASELPVDGGPLLLDAAFLVPRAHAGSFRALLAREARTLSRQGYGLTVSGPWPPYTFVRD